MNVSTFIRRHQLGSFFMLVFAVAWGLNAAYYLILPSAGPPAHISDVPLPRLFLLLLGTAASTATGFILSRVVGGKEGIREFTRSIQAVVCWNPLVRCRNLHDLGCGDGHAPVARDDTFAHVHACSPDVPERAPSDSTGARRRRHCRVSRKVGVDRLCIAEVAGSLSGVHGCVDAWHRLGRLACALAVLAAAVWGNRYAVVAVFGAKTLARTSGRTLAASASATAA